MISPTKRHRSRDERGEGVISAAIAVLIMAFLGAAMWVGFRATLGAAQRTVDNQVTRIGTDTGAPSAGIGLPGAPAGAPGGGASGAPIAGSSGAGG